MTTFPTNLRPLIDGDILRYEIGYAAQTGWTAITEDPEAVPPFDYVAEMLHQRISNIQAILQTEQKPELFITKGRTFRDHIAKRKPYKGTRADKKPWHFKNLTVYMADVLNARVIEYLEADDAMAIWHTFDPNTIIVSRDKDLRQVPGWFYSWELGNQPSFGPLLISKEGHLHLSDDHKKLTGTGLAFFYAQVLMGDPVDNIPGLPKYGPQKTHTILSDKSPDEMLDAVIREYARVYKRDWRKELLEQGRLCWMTRRLAPCEYDELPELWRIGMTE